MKGASTNITLPKPFVAEPSLKRYGFVKITIEGKKIIIEKADKWLEPSKNNPRKLAVILRFFEDTHFEEDAN